MFKSKLARATLVVSASAVLVVAMSSSAQAITNKTVSLPDSRGYMHFHDDGDVFSVCDTRADGHGVSGNLMNADNAVVFTLKDDTDDGCAKKGYNVGIRAVRMEIWWDGDFSKVYYSDWFRE
ncbi:hypothetical protein [Streptomyces griseoruber]|uniref:Uncharacterized protein n=1 Tax=Streptomyces griseoruber TaxID=1943 RepID=A0A124I0Y6_9ACTN|nr:hypothetical protein [Streptomyces griseoruber]KUN75746.1 hypothetical protein AQJ64_40685 [Streptomyces griseoruber]